MHIGILCALVILIACVWPYLPTQDNPNYFFFADTRSLLEIPNAGDVLSNLPFFIVGLVGLVWYFQRREKRLGHTYGAIVAVASILTCFGSAYFHWSPSPETLNWDRLPMTLAFCGVIALSVADRINERLSRWVFVALVPFGVFTIVGMDFGIITIRPYILLQFGGLIFVLLNYFFRSESRYPDIRLGTAAGFYAAAKLFESIDGQTFATLQFISGHTIKHLIAALALLSLLTFLKEKKS